MKSLFTLHSPLTCYRGKVSAPTQPRVQGSLLVVERRKYSWADRLRWDPIRSFTTYDVIRLRCHQRPYHLILLLSASHPTVFNSESLRLSLYCSFCKTLKLTKWKICPKLLPLKSLKSSIFEYGSSFLQCQSCTETDIVDR